MPAILIHIIMDEIILLIICILLILAIHVIEEFKFIKYVTLNRAIIADCIICAIYLLLNIFIYIIIWKINLKLILLKY